MRQLHIFFLLNQNLTCNCLLISVGLFYWFWLIWTYNCSVLMFRTILGSAQVNSDKNTEINKQLHVKFWLHRNKIWSRLVFIKLFVYNFKRTYQVSSVNGKKNEGKTCPNMCHESSSVPTRTIYIDSSLKKDCPYQPQSSQKRKTTLGMFDLKRQWIEMLI